MKLNKVDRAMLRMKFGGRCAYCGIELPDSRWHADHVEPVLRKMRVTHNERGQWKLEQTGEVWAPERDNLGNLFPSCQPCNTHKSVLSLETWRGELTRAAEILSNGYPTFRHAVRFRRVKVLDGPVIFWFEKWLAREAKSAMLESVQPSSDAS